MTFNNMILNDLKAGDIILFPPHKGDFIAQAIAFLTDGEVNHAAICYPADNTLKIAESILKDGLVLNPFPKAIEEQYPYRICRLSKDIALEPVIKEAEKYLNEKNSYPNFNLGLLGLLLLFKKIAPATYLNTVMYRFACLVSYELMLMVRKHKGKHPMSCSQFVSQCFTDAGTEYDLSFSDMSVVFKQKQLCASDHLISPASLLTEQTMLQTSTNAIETVQSDSLGMKIESMTEEDKIELTQQFIAMIETEKESMANGVLNTETTSHRINETMKNIAVTLYELITGETPLGISEALNFLQSSTARNFFVSPQDLFANCKDLKYIGNLSY